MGTSKLGASINGIQILKSRSPKECVKYMKLWLVKVPKLEKIYPSGWKIGSLRCKNSQALLFLEIIFLSLDLDCQNLAMLGFDNCPMISEKKNSLSEKNFAFEFFHLRATSFQPLGTIILSCTFNIRNSMISGLNLVNF